MNHCIFTNHINSWPSRRECQLEQSTNIDASICLTSETRSTTSIASCLHSTWACYWRLVLIASTNTCNIANTVPMTLTFPEHDSWDVDEVRGADTTRVGLSITGATLIFRHYITLNYWTNNATKGLTLWQIGDIFLPVAASNQDVWSSLKGVFCHKKQASA